MDGAIAVAHHESPFADVIVYLTVEILIVGMVGITLHAILFYGKSALETGCNPEILREYRRGIFHHHERISEMIAVRRQASIQSDSSIR